MIAGTALAQEKTGESAGPDRPEPGHETLLGVKKESPVVEEGIILWDKNGLKITLAGLLEAEAGYSYEYARGATGAGSADIVLSEWHIDLDVVHEDSWEGHLTLLWEEDDTEPADLDEGWLRYIKNGLFAGGGKTYLPFGTFDSFFVSDPFTLEIGEMRESGLFLGYESDSIACSAMISNGDLSKSGTPADRVYLWAAALEFSPVEELCLRFSGVSNIAEGDGFLAGALALDPFYTRRIGGFHASAHLALGPFEFVAETVLPFEPFDENDLDADANGRGDRPRAANFEAAFTVESEKSGTWTFAAKLEGARQLAGVPVRRSGIAISYNPSENVGIAVEYLYFVFDERFTPALRHGYSAALQLSLSF
jgi:hypothetical protein